MELGRTKLKLNPGDQVIYMPSHAPISGIAKFNYPNGPQPGFIFSGPNQELDYFVRYWIIKNGKPINELRTKANSELTPGRYLLVVKSVPQEWVEVALMVCEKELAG